MDKPNIFTRFSNYLKNFVPLKSEEPKQSPTIKPNGVNILDILTEPVLGNSIGDDYFTNADLPKK